MQPHTLLLHLIHSGCFQIGSTAQPPVDTIQLANGPGICRHLPSLAKKPVAKTVRSRQGCKHTEDDVMESRERPKSGLVLVCSTPGYTWHAASRKHTVAAARHVSVQMQQHTLVTACGGCWVPNSRRRPQQKLLLVHLHLQPASAWDMWQTTTRVMHADMRATSVLPSSKLLATKTTGLPYKSWHQPNPQSM
jgi:hypothetical protein